MARSASSGLAALRLALCGPLACMIALPLAPAPAAAQAAASAPAADASNPIDPEAMKAMDRMSAALLSLSSFRIDADVTTEQVLMTGQKIQFGGTVQILARRPDAFKIVADSDAQRREMFYDGKTFTIFAPRLGYYASFPAPSTIGLTIEKARRDFDIELPLADLFTWGTDQTLRSRVQEAMIVRPETIAGNKCTHYAFRQARVDWQLWIADNGTPLPCKIVITNKDDPAMPQYVAVLRWNTQTPPGAADLAFSPPANAHRITMADLSTAKGKGDGQ